MIYLNSLVLLLIAVSCSQQTQTNAQFVDELLTYVASKDERALFDQCYINSKSEIRTMLIELRGEHGAPDAEVSEMYNALKEDEHRVLRKYDILGIEDLQAVSVDSIVEKKQPKGVNSWDKWSEGFRASVLNVYITNDQRQYLMNLSCVDLNTGKWKLVNHPSIQNVR